jgi:hypothetical protein
VIANAVEGIEPGVYGFTPPDGFELVRAGSFRREAGYLCLEQPLWALAAGTIFLLAAPGPIPRYARKPRLPRHPARGRHPRRPDLSRRIRERFRGDRVDLLRRRRDPFVAPRTGKSALLAAAVGYPAT